ncbi:L,D-transpeptidase family protein [Pedobacter nototheniae]|uniref:L,D-transpeptidase family protein n=1 Tax=Pedobacter nototheniae TaxID=2488994 RepID=UPI001040BD1F|nr:L,D-transpeptidase family protein [Pedobacter nototheniae]
MKLIYFMFLLAFTVGAKAQDDFKTQQLKFERVRTAYKEKWEDLNKFLKHDGFGNHFSMAINAYKAEGKVEIWLKNSNEKKYKLFRTYDFCAHSGTLGPKVIEGDGQTPEGFYKVNVFNPMSNFYLSLGVDYPNATDLARTGKDRKPGGDIYIHGNCVTVGCIPLTDEKIKEVYVLAVEARNNGQQDIPVTIMPFKMTKANLDRYIKAYPQQKSFWEGLYNTYNKHVNNRP